VGVWSKIKGQIITADRRNRGHSYFDAVKYIKMVWTCLKERWWRWSKNCTAFEVAGAKQRRRLRKTWKEVVDKDMLDLELKPGDAVVRSRWKTKLKGCWCDSSN